MGNELTPLLAELNGAAERIWQDSSPTCPGLSIEVLPEIGSTNTELMARGRRGETTPVLLVAARQTAGRGRLGRSWQAEPGDTLTFSLGMPLDLARIPGGGSALSLAVGVALAEALDAGLDRHHLSARESTGHVGRAGNIACVGLKWPNDLWLDGRKLGGILIEASPAPGLPEGQRWVVIGVGLNIRRGSAPANAASLSEMTPFPAPRLGEVWHWITPALIESIQRFSSHGFTPLKNAFAQRDVLLGQVVGLWTQPGQGPISDHPPTQTGVAQGVDAQGALLVHTGQGVLAWHSGDVSVRPHAA